MCRTGAVMGCGARSERISHVRYPGPRCPGPGSRRSGPGEGAALSSRPPEYPARAPRAE
ncbi:hypothetical protein SSCG_05923 [Streptomyces clavuligerus]|nr:hypothetical protein SSCG_05923 [Streptomyces clavuligerus]